MIKVEWNEVEGCYNLIKVEWNEVEGFYHLFIVSSSQDNEIDFCKNRPLECQNNPQKRL